MQILWRSKKTLDIIKLVTDLGWYHGPDAKRADAHVITCPWSGEHTDGVVTAAAGRGGRDLEDAGAIFCRLSQGRESRHFVDRSFSDPGGSVRPMRH